MNIPAWLAGKLAGPLFAAAAILFFVGFAVQTVRIDGFPLFYTGMRTQLAEAEVANARANERAAAVVDKAREDGRAAAAQDSQRLADAVSQRQRDLDGSIARLGPIASRLLGISQQPPKPGEPPVVITPSPLPPVCRLDRTTLDDLRNELNMGRVP